MQISFNLLIKSCVLALTNIFKEIRNTFLKCSYSFSRVFVFNLLSLKIKAKKMNVESLRSGDKASQSAEIRIAKTAIGICALFVASWTPYAILALIGAFGNQ